MPKIVDKSNRREEIANAALEIFIEKGYEKASMGQVAKLLGMGKSSLYDYFTSKEELIFLAIKQWVKKLEEDSSIYEILQRYDSDPKEQLKVFVRVITKAFMADTRMIKFMLGTFHLMMSKDELILSESNILTDVLESSRLGVVGIIENGVSKKVFKESALENAQKIAINLLGFLDGIAMHFYMSKGYFDLNDQIEFYMDGLIVSISR